MLKKKSQQKEEIEFPGDYISAPLDNKNIPQTSATPSVSSYIATSKYNKNVINMQEAIIAFSNTVASVNSLMNDQSLKKDPLNTYLSANYLNQNLDTLAESLKRLGAPGSFGKVDGKWGPKTQEALQKIKIIANAFLTMAERFKIDLPYKKESLEQFTIPDKYQDIKDIDSYAITYTQHINQLTQSFNIFAKEIKTKYKDIIENKRKLIDIKLPSHEKIPQEFLTTEEKDIYESNRDARIAPDTSITLSTLYDKKQFNDFLEKNYPDYKNKSQEDKIKFAKDVLNLIKLKLNGK